MFKQNSPFHFFSDDLSESFCNCPMFILLSVLCKFTSLKITFKIQPEYSSFIATFLFNIICFNFIHSHIDENLGVERVKGLSQKTQTKTKQNR